MFESKIKEVNKRMDMSDERSRKAEDISRRKDLRIDGIKESVNESWKKRYWSFYRKAWGPKH